MEQKLSEQRANQNPEHVPVEGERLVYMMPANLARRDVTDEFDFLHLWRVLWQAKWLIAGITTLVAIAGLAYALLAKQWYSAEVILMPAASDGPQGGLGGQLGGLAGVASSLAGISFGAADSAEPLAVLTSKGFTRTFIEKHGLLPLLFADEWDAKARKWGAADQKDWPDIHDGVKYFEEHVRDVDEDKKTTLITVTIEWTDPQIAAEWANLLVKDLNDRMRQRSLQEAEANLEYLKRELSEANIVTMHQSIGRLLETELQKVMLAKGKQEFAFRIVDAASAPKWRSSPKRVQVMVLAVAFGIILGVIVAFIRNAVREHRASQSNNAPARARDPYVASGAN